jgi:hypothetical protein
MTSSAQWSCHDLVGPWATLHLITALTADLNTSISSLQKKKKWNAT